ncbi:MAG: uroporphyrinogen decarboxylase family protein [Asgard group archaeon]|nr:uroporphyrinogen decarboxylase family protein [Asgard group archaeon]
MNTTKIERLRQLVNGEPLKPVPYAIWRHFPQDDLYPKKLARKHIEYVKKFDPLLLKISLNGRYCVVDWGCEIAFDKEKITGSAHCVSYRIQNETDWETLEHLNVHEGMLGKQLRTLELILKGIPDQTPCIFTVFNPLMVASKLTEDRSLLKQSMQNNPEIFHEGLNTITKVTKDFAKAAIDIGASGIFLATQEATYNFLTPELYEEFALQYDLRILNTIKERSEFNILHIHGENIMFDFIADHYPVHALNWHDQLTPPSIIKAQEKFDGVLMGGIDEKNSLLQAPARITSQTIQSIAQAMNYRQFIAAPGCVIPITASDEKLSSIIEDIKSNLQ